MTRRRFLQGAALAIGAALAGFRFLDPTLELMPKVIETDTRQIGFYAYEEIGICYVSARTYSKIKIGDSHGTPRKVVDYSLPVLAA